jgi:protein TonB
MNKTLILIFIFSQLLSFGQENPKEPIRIPLAKEEGKEDSGLSFAIIEEALIFPGCENVERSKRMNCFQEKLDEHILENLKYPPKAKKQKIEGKVIVKFTINYEGKVTNIMTQLGDPILQTEALRIIRLLPVMKPALFKGKPIGTNYSVQITFKLQ